jgi:hypothetical protein
MNASTVRVIMPGQPGAVNVKFNASTRAVLTRASRSQGVYMVRSVTDAGLLTPHIVNRQSAS